MNCQLIKDILRYHKIHCYALHTTTTGKNRFSKIFFLSVLDLHDPPDISGVLLTVKEKNLPQTPKALSEPRINPRTSADQCDTSRPPSQLNVSNLAPSSFTTLIELTYP